VQAFSRLSVKTPFRQQAVEVEVGVGDDVVVDVDIIENEDDEDDEDDGGGGVAAPHIVMLTCVIAVSSLGNPGGSGPYI
jgi:hypothetical protein